MSVVRLRILVAAMEPVLTAKGHTLATVALG